MGPQRETIDLGDQALAREYLELKARVDDACERAGRLRSLADHVEEQAQRDQHALEELAGALGFRAQLQLEELDRTLVVAADVAVLPLDVREMLDPRGLRPRSDLLHLVLAHQSEVTLDHVSRHHVLLRQVERILRPPTVSWEIGAAPWSAGPGSIQSNFNHACD